MEEASLDCERTKAREYNNRFESERCQAFKL